MKGTKIKLLITTMTLALFSSFASAVAITDVTYNSMNANQALLGLGNDDASKIMDLYPSDPWQLLTKSDGTDGSSIAGVDFSVSASASEGTFSLSWSASDPADLPLIMDVVFVTKAGPDYFGAYLFEDLVFTSNPLFGTGTFTIAYENRGGNTPALSHLSVYGRSPSNVEVSEPAGLALFGLGILGLAAARRRLA